MTGERGESAPSNQRTRSDIRGGHGSSWSVGRQGQRHRSQPAGRPTSATAEWARRTLVVRPAGVPVGVQHGGALLSLEPRDRPRPTRRQAGPAASSLTNSGVRIEGGATARLPATPSFRTARVGPGRRCCPLQRFRRTANTQLAVENTGQQWPPAPGRCQNGRRRAYGWWWGLLVASAWRWAGMSSRPCGTRTSSRCPRARHKAT